MARDLFAEEQKPVGRNLFAAQNAAPAEPQAQEPGSLTQAQYAERYGDIPDIGGLIMESEPKPERTIGERALGAGEAALSTITGATTGAAGALTGTVKGIIDEVAAGNFGEQEAANRIANLAAEYMQSMTYAPRTEAGQEYTQAIGEAGQALAPLAGLGGELAVIGQGAKQAAPAVRQAATAAKETAKPTGQVIQAAFKYQSPTKQRIAKMLEEYAPDIDTARYRLSEPASKDIPETRLLRALNSGGARIKSDPVAIEAINQGFDEGVVAAIKGAASADKAAMQRMVGIFEKGKSDALYRSTNRPSDVVGERISQQFGTIRAANRKAGKAIDAESRALKGKQIESAQIGDRFASDLQDMGIGITDDLKLVFKGSDVEDLPSVERTLSTVFRRMAGPDKPDAYELHRMKRFIDEQVSYGKAGEGLTGRSEAALKRLRRDIDQTLDSQFPEYKKANDIYADTISAIDSLQGVAGRKLDLSGENAPKQLGVLMRRVLSNAQSRTTVLDAAREIDRVSRAYPEQLLLEGPYKTGRKPDIVQLVLFADELDSRFGPSARTSFQGQIEQVAERGRRVAQSASPTVALTDAAIGAAARGIDKVRGVTDAKALEAIKKLLAEDYEVKQ